MVRPRCYVLFHCRRKVRKDREGTELVVVCSSSLCSLLGGFHNAQGTQWQFGSISSSPVAECATRLPLLSQGEINGCNRWKLKWKMYIKIKRNMLTWISKWNKVWLIVKLIIAVFGVTCQLRPSSCRRHTHQNTGYLITVNYWHRFISRVVPLDWHLWLVVTLLKRLLF